MSSNRFEKRRLKKPELPLGAVIESENGVTWGFVETLSLDGLYIRQKNHVFTGSKDRVIVDLFLAASNGPSIFRTEARIVRIDEAGIALQFRPMPLAHHNRLRAIIAFVTPDEETHIRD